MHLARVWVIIAATFALMIVLESTLAAQGLSPWWALPAAVAAITVIGASQHQLGGAIHEGTHFLLFENKRLNELASDWLAGFPIYTSTYQYRVHHLAHHQFVNDPARDPDISQLKDSGHWLDFPVTHIDVLRKLLKQLWLPNIFRFTLYRAKYSALGHEHNPYLEKGKPQEPMAGARRHLLRRCRAFHRQWAFVDPARHRGLARPHRELSCGRDVFCDAP